MPAIAYSIISPIINGLACVSFILLYFGYKYLFVWVVDQPAWAETGGLFFPKAVDHVFVGLYLEQICLATLFFLARDEDGQVRVRCSQNNVVSAADLGLDPSPGVGRPRGGPFGRPACRDGACLPSLFRLAALRLIPVNPRPSSTTYFTTRSVRSRRPFP